MITRGFVGILCTLVGLVRVVNITRDAFLYTIPSYNLEGIAIPFYGHPILDKYNVTFDKYNYWNMTASSDLLNYNHMS